MSRIPWITPDDEYTPFPPVERALREPNGLIAAGGPLTPPRLEQAYRAGIFPWFAEEQPVLWWSPDPRTIIVPGRMHLSRSLCRLLRCSPRRATLDTDFEQVIDRCAAPRPDQSGTWITPAMRDAYIELHRRGRAHSAELWEGGSLVGGVYGVAIGGAFFGESMFSGGNNGSKMALAYLLAQLRRWGFGLLDCQMPTPHLASLGAVTIPRRSFIETLQRALALGERQASWTFDTDLDPLEAGMVGR